MDKRAGLRQFYQTQSEQAQAEKRFNDRSKQLASLENTTIQAMNALISFLDGKTTKTEVVNQLKSISTPDVDKVVEAVTKLDNNITANRIDLKPLEQVLAAIRREVSLIPKTHAKAPEKLDSIKVNNLSDVKFDTSVLEKAIKNLELNPKISVQSPTVNVEKPDLKPIQDLMLDLLKAVRGIEIPEIPKIDIPKTDLSKVEKKLDDANKHLKDLVEKPTGGGGGGGNGTPYLNSQGKATYLQLDEGGLPTTTLAQTVRIDDTATPIIYIGKATIGTATSSGSQQISRLDTSSGLIKTWADGDSAYNNVWDNRAALTYL